MLRLHPFAIFANRRERSRRIQVHTTVGCLGDHRRRGFLPTQRFNAVTQRHADMILQHSLNNLPTSRMVDRHICIIQCVDTASHRWGWTNKPFTC